MAARSDIELPSEETNNYFGKKVDTTWVDVKFAEKPVSEVLFCIWPLLIVEKLTC